MKVIVFGSNGLVGSSICKYFSQDENITLHASTRKDTNLFSLEQTKTTINNFTPDVIINAAAKVGGIVANNTLRTEFILENLKININLLESCIPYNNIQIINLGSSCIYPLNAENPIKESSFMSGILEPTNSPYAMAKITAIEMGKTLNKDYGHKVINLMPTNLYGPNDNFSKENSHVIPGIIKRMHEIKSNGLESFGLWGSGEPLREFLFVDDLSDAIEFIVDNNIKDYLINVGSGKEISIYDLACLIKEIMNFSGEIIFDSSKPDGNPRKLLDSSLINSYGWESKVDLEEGLEITYKWFLKNIKG